MQTTALFKGGVGRQMLYTWDASASNRQDAKIQGSEDSPLHSQWVWYGFCPDGHRPRHPMHSGEYEIVMLGANCVQKAWYDKPCNGWYMGRLNVVPLELIACWRGCTIPFYPEG